MPSSEKLCKSKTDRRQCRNSSLNGSMKTAATKPTTNQLLVFSRSTNTDRAQSFSSFQARDKRKRKPQSKLNRLKPTPAYTSSDFLPTEKPTAVQQLPSLSCECPQKPGSHLSLGLKLSRVINLKVEERLQRPMRYSRQTNRLYRELR